MSKLQEDTVSLNPVTVHCTQCGQPMRVAQEHLETRVACPHCRTVLEPWRMAGEPASPPPVPSDPGGGRQAAAGGRHDGRPHAAPPYVAQPHNLHSPTPVSAPTHRGPLPGYSTRNRWIAGALAILLGPFGVHRFYLGYTGIGILMCVLTVGSFFVLSWVVGIWAFVEGILCFVGAFHDAEGKPLRG